MALVQVAGCSAGKATVGATRRGGGAAEFTAVAFKWSAPLPHRPASGAKWAGQVLLDEASVAVVDVDLGHPRPGLLLAKPHFAATKLIGCVDDVRSDPIINRKDIIRRIRFDPAGEWGPTNVAFHAAWRKVDPPIELVYNHTQTDKRLCGANDEL